MPDEITQRLEAAKVLIHFAVKSHQSDLDHAVRYAIRMTNLPSDLQPQLLEWAKNL